MCACTIRSEKRLILDASERVFWKLICSESRYPFLDNYYRYGNVAGIVEIHLCASVNVGVGNLRD